MWTARRSICISMLFGQVICLVISYVLSTESVLVNINEIDNSGDSDEYDRMG